jgi:hypothetical protein
MRGPGRELQTGPGLVGGRSHVHELVTDALAQAVAVCGGNVGGTIMHSDRGTQGSTRHERWSRASLMPGCVDRWVPMLSPIAYEQSLHAATQAA